MVIEANFPNSYELTGEQVISQLKNVQTNFILNNSIVEILFNNQEMLDDFKLKISDYEIDCTGFLLDFYEPNKKEHYFNELKNSITRTLVRESLDIVKTYAKETGQWMTIEKDNTIMIAEVIRNAFSHGYVIDPIGRIKTVLKDRDIKSGDIVLSKSNIGDKITQKYFNNKKALELNFNIIKLVNEKLS